MNVLHLKYAVEIANTGSIAPDFLTHELDV